MSDRVYRLLSRHQKLDEQLRRAKSRLWADPFEIARRWLAEAAPKEPNDPNAIALATVDAEGGMELDDGFFVDFGDQRPHQVRLQGGDASTDSYCFA